MTAPELTPVTEQPAVGAQVERSVRPRRTRQVVGALIDGEVTWHADANSGANYHTLCGLSLDDDIASKVPAKRGQKINCEMCRQAWDAARLFRSKDFEA